MAWSSRTCTCVVCGTKFTATFGARYCADCIKTKRDRDYEKGSIDGYEQGRREQREYDEQHTTAGRLEG